MPHRTSENHSLDGVLEPLLRCLQDLLCFVKLPRALNKEIRKGCAFQGRKKQACEGGSWRILLPSSLNILSF